MVGKLVVGMSVAVLLLAAFAETAIAQDTPPPPYAGLTNPFSWDDASAQRAGRAIYQQSCLGCHGPSGDNIATSRFSATQYGDRLQASPDVIFWILTEGRMSSGMPPFESGLSEQQRWQVLTYVRSLSAVSQAPTTPAPAESGSLSLVVPGQGRMGEEITLTATLKDGAGNPVQGEPVRFFVTVDFFATGQMEIGESVTGANGDAVLKYIPRVAGERQFSVRHGSAEVVAAVSLEDTGALFYQSEAGLKLPAAGPVVFVGPDSATRIGEMGQAPTSAFYLPGGLTSWLLLVVAAIAMVWFSYFRVIRQIAGIPGRQDSRDADTRLVPRLALAYVVTLGVLLALKIVIGPYTHFHLLQ